jgi:hypothetical protein
MSEPEPLGDGGFKISTKEFQKPLIYFEKFAKLLEEAYGLEEVLARLPTEVPETFPPLV